MLGATMPAAGPNRNSKAIIESPKINVLFTADKPSKKSSLGVVPLLKHIQRESLLNKGLAGLRNLRRATVPHFHC
jgi:hypothetical protein